MANTLLCVTANKVAVPTMSVNTILISLSELFVRADMVRTSLRLILHVGRASAPKSSRLSVDYNIFDGRGTTFVCLAPLSLRLRGGKGPGLGGQNLSNLEPSSKAG